MDIYTAGPTFTVTVADSSVGFTAEQLQPTTGIHQGKNMEKGLVQAVGPLYIELSGAAATTASYPMTTGDSLLFEGYENLKNFRFIRNTNSTTAVVIPFYQ